MILSPSFYVPLVYMIFSQLFYVPLCIQLGGRGGRVMRRCWVDFQCQGVLLIWIIVGQGPIALVVGAGGGCLDFLSLVCLFSFLSPTLEAPI